MNSSDLKKDLSRLIIGLMEDNHAQLCNRPTRCRTVFRPNSRSHFHDIFIVKHGDDSASKEATRKWIAGQGLVNEENFEKIIACFDDIHEMPVSRLAEIEAFKRRAFSDEAEETAAGLTDTKFKSLKKGQRAFVTQIIDVLSRETAQINLGDHEPEED